MKLAKSLAAALLLSIAASGSAQTFTDPANLRGERVRPRDGRELPIDQGASGLQQLLRKLNTRASLMLIVAHPDDEDGGMLTLYSRGLGARVAVLTLNRGEGGQNAMTGDFGDALGLLRTQELLSADRYFAVDQFFGTEVDFGFSKTKEEAFAKWTHERVLYDAVRAVRLFRPLVIASVFVGGVTDGHGQHQVAGQIAQEVFNAAGDPKVLPELTAEGILPWQPLKVYARVPMQSITAQGLFDYATGQYTPARFTNYVTGEVTTTEPSVDVVVHEGATDPLLADPDGKPRSYVQFARIGLGLQRSQIGPGVRNVPSGAYDIAYHRYGSRLANQPSHEDSFFDGIDTSVKGIASLAPHAPPAVADLLKVIGLEVEQITSGIVDSKLAPNTALLLADNLHRVDATLQLIESTPSDSSFSTEERANVLHELRVKHVQFNDALASALGLSLSLQGPSVEQTEGISITTHVRLALSRPMPFGTDPYLNLSKPVTLTYRSGRGVNSQGDGLAIDPPEAALSVEHPSDLICKLAANQSPATKPYFFRSNIEQPTYELLDRNLRNAPGTPPALTCHVELALDWLLTHEQIVVIQLDAIASALSVPPASLSLASHAQVVPNDKHSVLIKTVFYPIKKPAIEPKLSLPPGWKSHVALSDVDAPGEMVFAADAPLGGREPGTIAASAMLSNHQTVSEGYRSVGYGDLPRTNFYTPATLRIVPVDLNLPARHRIAYLPGTGDPVPEALASIGLTPTLLTVADLTAPKLAQFDTVVLGVRTYNAHPDLHGAPTKALLDFARSGGNVIVQFQTPEFTAADAPFPLTLGYAEKVVDETVPVQLLDAAAPLFNTPNRITSADFNNWVEERGHGFLRTWDAHYTALTETHDPGQAPQRGGLITTPLGKGRWTYCAFALYRQLPEAVPGAFRLFANLLNP